MLDSQADTDDVLEVRRRCRSFDALQLPRDGSDIPLWFADDDGDVVGRRRPLSDRPQVPLAAAAGGGGDEAVGGRCLSASDLLATGDDYDPSWCSVNNLETDCVSPRVSSNSLFSQLDAGTAASSDDVGLSLIHI